MTITELRAFFHRHRHDTTDRHGFGYSRDTDLPVVTVPVGVELHFFTGRTRKEATR